MSTHMSAHMSTHMSTHMLALMLTHITLQIRTGVMLLGPAACGKSTVVSVLAAALTSMDAQQKPPLPPVSCVTIFPKVNQLCVCACVCVWCVCVCVCLSVRESECICKSACVCS